MHRFQGIVSVSQRNRVQCVEGYGVPDERVLVVPNAADPGRFHPSEDRAALRRRLGVDADRALVVFVGHFEERKGPLRLVEALGDLPGVGLALLGSGPQSPRSPAIVFSGHVAPPEVADWLAAADLFVLPTLEEGSPNAVIEALACGAPVVSYDIPALRETVDSECAVLVEPRGEGLDERAPLGAGDELGGGHDTHDSPSPPSSSSKLAHAWKRSRCLFESRPRLFTFGTIFEKSR